MTQRFPSIKSVAHDLAIDWRYLRNDLPNMRKIEGLEPVCIDVRLQVLEDGRWAVHSGDASYDLDHHGYWGASSISYGRQNLADLARDLIEQCRDDYAQRDEAQS